MYKLQYEAATINKIINLWELFYQPKLMDGALKIGLFNHLEKFTGADVLANKLNQDPKTMKLLLDSISLMDLIEKKGNKYKNSPDSSALFVEGKEDYLKTLIAEWKDNSDDSYLNIIEILDKPVYRKYFSKYQNTDIKNKSGEGNQSDTPFADIAPTIQKKLREIPNYSSFDRMLDITGGTGFFTFYFVLNHPVMKGIIIEREQAAKALCKFIYFYGVNDRITTLPADLFYDPIGDGYDFVWAGPASDYLKNNIKQLLAKINKSLKPGGIFAILHEGLNDEIIIPEMILSYKHFSIPHHEVIANLGGELSQLVQTYGFKEVCSSIINTPFGEMELNICRKE